MEFPVENEVFIKVSPIKGVIIFDRKKGQLEIFWTVRDHIKNWKSCLLIVTITRDAICAQYISCVAIKKVPR